LLRVLDVALDELDAQVAEGSLGVCPPGETELVVGHAAVAEVRGIGEGVVGLCVGDLVVPVPRRGPDVRGLRRLHGFATPWTVDEPEHLVRVPESWLGYAVLLEPLARIERAVEALDGGRWRGRALVVGSGAVAVLGALALRQALPATPVALAAERELPSEHVRLLRLAGVDIVAAGDGERPAVVVETTGRRSHAERAGSVVRPDGAVLLLGWPWEVAGGVDCTAPGPDHVRRALRRAERLDARWPGALDRGIGASYPLGIPPPDWTTDLDGRVVLLRVAPLAAEPPPSPTP
jgi:threonine dehydrogenase-like Zn-dependent dehydrogenase